MSEVHVDPVRRQIVQGGSLTPPGPSFPRPAWPILGGVVCDGCGSRERCKRERLCWAAEREAIEAERAEK